MIKISKVFSEDFKIETIALFDITAYLKCIKESIIPKCFYEETKEKLSATNNSNMKIKYEVEVSIANSNFLLKTTFVLMRDITHSAS